jgi:hypothetical protein
MGKAHSSPKPSCSLEESEQRVTKHKIIPRNFIPRGDGKRMGKRKETLSCKLGDFVRKMLVFFIENI